MAAPQPTNALQRTSQVVPRAWWKETTVYQTYIPSFFDSNGDGVGDIPGIIAKLDYLQDLGIETVWVTPFFKSSQADMGYDISDYFDVHQPYGTMADITNLIDGLHWRQMKFVMDLVVNHTSDEHAWFQASKASTDNPFRDWYVWRKGQVDENGRRKPPNNWRGMFGGSVWTYDERTREYYLHCFHEKQPDLNWENPQVVEAVHQIIKFWLAKGVDGFRLDVICFVSKCSTHVDAPVTNPDSELQDAATLFANGPRLHEHLKGLGKMFKAHGVFSVGEMPFARDKYEVLQVVAPREGELDMIFQFDIVDMDVGPGGKFTPQQWQLLDLKANVDRWQTFMFDHGGWNALFIENHDQARSVSRFASDEPSHRFEAAKMLAIWLACQSGTLYIYQGQEIGMRNVPLDWSDEEYVDVESQNAWAELLASPSADASNIQALRSQLQLKARDNARTPVQWSSETQGGFTTAARSWMRVNPDYAVCNAASQIQEKSSVLRCWAGLVKMRQKYKDVFIYGSFRLVDAENETIFAYERRCPTLHALIISNWSDKPYAWAVPSPHAEMIECGEVVQSNYHRRSIRTVDGVLSMGPWEAVVLLMDVVNVHL